jgi:hypothetical protein
MPAFDALGPIYGDPITVLPSTTATASGNGGAVPSGPYNTFRLTLDVTAASGTTPSLTVTIQTSADGSTGWTTLGTAFNAATAVSNQRKVLSGADRFVRASYTISGTTPSFTFSVTGQAI